MTTIKLDDLLADPNNTVKTADPQLQIQIADRNLAVGQHRFSLTVVDDSGNVSKPPAIITVIVEDQSAPTAVLDLRNEAGQQVLDGRIAFGSGFILDGSRSTDIGGRIESYSWALLAQ